MEKRQKKESKITVRPGVKILKVEHGQVRTEIVSTMLEKMGTTSR